MNKQLVTQLKNSVGKKLKTNHNGFSLIELMIVVAIIGVLTSIALPRYQDFISKAEFVETKLAVGAVKVGVEVCVQTLGLANSNNCVNNSNGIPADVDVGAEVVGITLTGTAPNKSSDVAENDTFIITATAPSGSRNNGAIYRLTGTLAANGRVTWDDGFCSDGMLC